MPRRAAAALACPRSRARLSTSHFVASDTPGMSYGNGLMRVLGGGARSYLHHTGGMVSFSSSFHLDLASGVGAFASATVGAFLEYRPRLLTSFAVDALTNAASGRPLPAAAVADRAAGQPGRLCRHIFGTRRRLAGRCPASR